ncbi:MAG: nucleoid-associated protein [Bacteroidetes bacterium]|nr:nucleoid-associated protein [Bacteroidota bacterium]
MIEFTRAELKLLSLNFVGNKALGEELTIGKNLIDLTDSLLKDTLTRYFSQSFKTDVYYCFKNKSEFAVNPVENFCRKIFKNQTNFKEDVSELAVHLHSQSNHPKIKSGEFYACYFKDTMIDGELCDCVGLFKTENKDTFITVHEHLSDFSLVAEQGINIQKIDKGCLIFNSDSNNGFKISIIDNTNSIAECAQYWEYDFIGAELKQNAFYHTKNFIDASRGFCEEVLTEANNVKKPDQMMMLNRSTSYFKDKSRVNVEDFEKDVLVEPDLISAFKDYRTDYMKRLQLNDIDEFDVSQTAVKKNQKYMRSVVKLDKNFHLYIHSRHDYVERGYDEDKGMKFYKLFFVNEE